MCHSKARKTTLSNREFLWRVDDGGGKKGQSMRIASAKR
jgi:hypothetical protein